MRFFKASVPSSDGTEIVYLKAETWFSARDLARRLYPMETFEPVWKAMELLENPPAPGSLVFGWHPETKEAQFAEGYERDPAVAAKRRQKRDQVKKAAR